MVERTAAEAKAANISVMGDALGTVYSELWQEVAWIHHNWAHYQELFGEKSSRIDLLNEVAPAFFRTVQDTLFEAVLLHLTRLTDPPQSVGKSNLSLRQLVALTAGSPANSRVSELIARAIDATDFARDWRNRRLAHRDLDLALGQPVTPLAPASRLAVKQALGVMVDVLNVVSARYLDSTSFFDLPGDSDSVALLYTLRDGLEAEKQRLARLSSGNFREEDVRQEEI
jgi:hypothetical protein